MNFLNTPRITLRQSIEGWVDLWYLCIVRLLNAFAEEQATEDAVYYMGEALRKGVVELDVFLKVTAFHDSTELSITDAYVVYNIAVYR